MKNKKEKSKKSPKKVTNQEKALLIVFFLLCLLVIGLLIAVIRIKNQGTNKANVLIPVLKESMESEIGVDLSSLKASEEKEYVFKIANYKGSEVNKQEIKYDINITPSESATIELYKNNSKTNLLADNNYKLLDNVLMKNKKTEDEYHLLIKMKSKPINNDKITIIISS